MLTRYGYTGRELDTDTGLMYYRARWYDPQAGRFISEDPIGFDGGMNWYAYVENNPINFNDPSGLCAEDNNTQRCTALIKRMLKQITEMERLLKKYDPVKDYKGGYTSRKVLPNGRVKEFQTKPGGHYRGIENAQNALRRNYEAFKRECMNRNDSSNTGLPSEAEEYATKEVQAPYDPNAPNLFSDIQRWLEFPTSWDQIERQRQMYPWLFPPAVPLPGPRRIP